MDKNYWDSFYKKVEKDETVSLRSSFAKFCLDRFFNKKKINIIDLGSGNGRDSVYFANQGYKVIAIDQSPIGIKILNKNLKTGYKKNLILKIADFVQEDFNKYKNINVFYSRFTIHSITKNEEKILLKKIYNSLANKGLFCIEVRTTKDPIYGTGKSCGDNTFIRDGHKRRFIDSIVFRKQVTRLGFKELYFTEKNNLSIYKKDNPVLMRLILEK